MNTISLVIFENSAFFKQTDATADFTYITYYVVIIHLVVKYLALSESVLKLVTNFCTYET